MLTLSWKRYDDQYQLSELLTEAARACVDARASHPGAFLASYFTKVTSGDSVDSLTCEKLYTPHGDMGLSLTVRLFTNASVTTSAYFSRDLIAPERGAPSGVGVGSPTTTTPSLSLAHEKAEGALAGILMNSVRLLHQYASETLLPSLRQIGVCQQNDWDAVIEDGRWDGFNKPAATPDDIGEECLPSSMCFSFSLAASLVASKSLKTALYAHFCGIYALQRPISMLGSKPHQTHKPGIPSDHYTLPRVVLPFFGRSDTTAVSPPGTVCFQTLYLIPTAPASPFKAPVPEDGDSSAAPPPDAVEDEDDPVNPKGLLSEEVFERLILAYRLFREKYNNPAIREDGAFVYVNAENIVDAVQVASEIIVAAGLKPGIDVSFGMRINCPVTRHNPEAIAASNAPSGKGKRVPKDQGKLEEVMYTLFSGDAEVTGAQVSEYLFEQVQLCNGLLVFLEDTHDAQNVAGIHRLMNRLGQCVIISGQSMYSVSPGNNSFEMIIQKLENGISSMWSHNFSLQLRQIGTVTRIMGLTKLLDVNRRSFTLAVRSDEREVTDMVDLAIGISARYLLIGGLTIPSSCDALAHYVRVQVKLLQMRALNDQPAINTQMTFMSELPPISDEPVAEIKRKNDKKKKKPTGKH